MCASRGRVRSRGGMRAPRASEVEVAIASARPCSCRCCFRWCCCVLPLVRCVASVGKSRCCFRRCVLKKSQPPIARSDCSLSLTMVRMPLLLQQEVHVVAVVEGDADVVLARRLHLQDWHAHSHRGDCHHHEQHAVVHCKVCCSAVLRRSACVATPGCLACSQDLRRP